MDQNKIQKQAEEMHPRKGRISAHFTFLFR